MTSLEVERVEEGVQLLLPVAILLIFFPIFLLVPVDFNSR
jgi:hypothetical protein